MFEETEAYSTVTSVPSVVHPGDGRTLISPSDGRGAYDPVFVNGMLKAVWPMVGEFAKKVVSDIVEPAVKAALGELGDVFSIDMQTFDLGDRATEFGELDVEHTVQQTSDAEAPTFRVMTVRSTLTWHARLTAFGHIAALRIGVTHVRLQGDLVMELVGELPRPPFFQGARVCFINPPSLSLDCHSGSKVVDKVAQSQAIKVALQQVASEQLAQRMVFPNRMGFRLAPEADMFTVLHPRPRGMLLMTICRAAGLRGMDRRLIGGPTSDPFVKLACGAMKFQTQVVKATLNPTFDEQVRLPIHQPNEQVVTFELLDQDSFGKHDFLGVASVRIADLIASGGKEVPLSVDGRGEQGDFGTLYLRAEWRDLLLQSVPALPKADKAGEAKPSYVFVGVSLAKDVPIGPVGTKYWVEVQCSNRLGLLGQSVKQAKPTKKVMMSDLVVDKEEREMKATLMRERLEICKKYNMSEEDAVRLLGVEAVGLELCDAALGKDTTLLWNAPVEFFIGDCAHAELDISLKCQEPASDRNTHGNVMSKLSSVISTKMREAAHNMLGEAGTVLYHWKLPIRDVLEQERATSNPILQVGDTPTTLHLRVQVRSVGEPTSEIA